MAYFRCGQGGGSSLTIQISTTSESLYGQTITISKNGSTVGTTTFDNQGEAEYTVDEAGIYTVSATVSGTTYSDTVEVTDTFEASIEAGFNYHTWLVEGDVSDTYSSLNEVLADEEAVRKLMTIHDAVDYLANFTDTDTSVVAILNNDLAAKWISLTDYAMDVLEAAYGTLMGTIGKYGYGEWALEMVDAVPTMTSNTTPSGEVISGGLSNSTNAYKAFDGSDSTSADGAPSSGSLYIGYDFGSPVVIYKASILLGNYYGRFYGFKAQGTNDLSEPWTDLSAEHTITQSTLYTFNFTTTGSYRYYRIIGTNQANAIIQTIQFIKGVWQPKGAVPIMTSNTAPYGEASASSVYGTGYEAYRAFDGSLSTIWHSSGTSAAQYVRYKFTNPVYVKKASVYCTTDTDRMATVILQGSNDGSTWVDVSEDVKSSLVSGWNDIPVTKNGGYYLYYQINFGTCYSVHISELQFYGRVLKVSVPTMTSNTSPYGEASANAYHHSDSDYAPWRAFNGTNASTGWLPNAWDDYVYYHFTSPVLATKLSAYFYDSQSRAIRNTIQVIASHDGSIWENLDSPYTMSGTNVTDSVSFDNNTAYEYYGVKSTGSASGHSVSNGYGWHFQFFGVDYSEREWDTEHPRHYIYDHGLELDTFVKASYADSSAIIEKRPSEILLQIPSPSGSKQSAIAKTIDLTDYELMRMCIGDEYVNGTYESLGIYNTSYSVVISRLRPLSDLPYNAGVDTSSVNGTYEIVIETSNKLTVTEWWLE